MLLNLHISLSWPCLILLSHIMPLHNWLTFPYPASTMLLKLSSQILCFKLVSWLLPHFETKVNLSIQVLNDVYLNLPYETHHYIAQTVLLNDDEEIILQVWLHRWVLWLWWQHQPKMQCNEDTILQYIYTKTWLHELKRWRRLDDHPTIVLGIIWQFLLWVLRLIWWCEFCWKPSSYPKVEYDKSSPFMGLNKSISTTELNLNLNLKFAIPNWSSSQTTAFMLDVHLSPIVELVSQRETSMNCREV